MKTPDIIKTTTFNAPIEKVWQAVATTEGLSSWFMENDFHAEEGANFHLQSPFGPSPCTVLEIDPPYKLVFSWGTDGWFVIMELKESEGKTAFSLTHGGWGESDELVPLANATHEAIRERMNGGWEPLVNVKLRQVIEG